MTDAADHTSADFDVYARPFIPQALKNVNEAPANIRASQPVPWIDYNRYVSTFAGTEFLRPRQPPCIPSVDEITPRPGIPAAPCNTSRDRQLGSVTDGALEPAHYHAQLHQALVTEAACQQEECDDHALYRTVITKADPKVDGRPFIYVLNVPGLRELSLRIEVGDIVPVRQIRFDIHGNAVSGSVFKDQYGKPVDTPVKADTQHNATVWSVDRLRENLALRIENLKPRSMLFNVRFTVQWARFNAMYEAVIAARDTLNKDDSWMRSMLFPVAADGYYQKTLNRLDHSLDLNDPLLNREQARAVSTAVDKLYGPVPYIISGPPGTGKTKTMVELALQLLAKRHRSHLLVCAPSESAADTLVQRLSRHLKPSDLFRLNSPARNFPEVPMMILPYCHVENNMFSLPPFKELMRKKIVVTTCRDAEVLVRAGLTNTDLCRLEQNLSVALYFDDTPTRPQSLHWTALLIDEAAQATEPEALIPMTVVQPPNDHATPDRDLPIFVLAGDQHQLGARTASKCPAVQTSLFERLLTRPFYAGHPLARPKQSNGVIRPLTQAMLPILRPAFTNLIRNYRSHPAMLATPSKLFYADTLEPEAPNTDALSTWPGWPRPGWPVLFSVNTGPDEIERDGGGWYNVSEAELACSYAKSFITSGLVAPRDVCIMSPFRAQVRVLRKLARSAGYAMHDVDIGPLEAFQGLEKRVVILCTTRTRERFVDQDRARGLGVIGEPKRFNVAMTRAMQGLVVVGHPGVLKRDGCWREFLGFCGRNGLWEDKKGDWGGWKARESGDGEGVSRLERMLWRRDDEAGEVQGPDSGGRRLGAGRDVEEEIGSRGWQLRGLLKRRRATRRKRMTTKMRNQLRPLKKQSPCKRREGR